MTNERAARKPLRLWPGIIAAVLLLLARWGLKAVVPGFQGFGWSVQGGFIGVAAILLWWLFFSRAAWSERLGAIVLMIVALGAAWFLRHESMGPLWVFAYAIPILFFAFVAWAVASRRLAGGLRRATMVATVVLAGGGWMLVRMEGISGDHAAQFAWRWAPSSEERLLAQARNERLEPAGGSPAALPPAPVAGPASEKRREAEPGSEPVDSARGRRVELPLATPVAKTRAEWPGFRGPERDGSIRGVRIETDWSRTPPIELWRRSIGPGWSSFAVGGDRLYTQEQRGDEEVVACYKVTTGAPVWRHRDATRFFEANGGAGPRGTPTLSSGRVYTFGATGILNALDAGSGAVVWSRNVASDTDAKVPYWGFSSSPLVVDDVVIVAASSVLAAYDLATGTPRWTDRANGDSYSSPHLATIGGVAQILLMNGAGATSVAPADGRHLWEYPWPGFPIVQPAVTEDGDVLIVAGGGSGTRRIAVAQGPAGWTVEERWTSLGLKPYFNDFVVHEGHAFGFDGRILSCIDLANGERKWKGGRYGNGQMVLLPDQDLLLVLSEEGELALVRATPDEFTEVARFKAIEGKTWNHPVLVGERLLVRNGEEMVAFRLSLAGR